MLDKKFKISILAVIAVMQIFTLSSIQANNLYQEKDTFRNILLAEALVEYPFGWFYTLDEMEELYEVEYYENKRLENFIRYENGKCLNQCNNGLSEVPWQFIEKTLKLIKQMLDRGLAKYLFRLDAFHGHLFVSDNQFERKYLNLNSNDMIKEFVSDEFLGVLFHCSEHLALRNPPKTGEIDKEAQELINQRNIIGWYDMESIEVFNARKIDLVGNGKSNTATIPKGHHCVGSITFKANINGEFSIKHAGQTIRLDISLCDYYYH